MEWSDCGFLPISPSSGVDWRGSFPVPGNIPLGVSLIGTVTEDTLHSPADSTRSKAKRGFRISNPIGTILKYMSEPAAYRCELRYDRWDEDAWHEVVRTIHPQETQLPEKDNVEIRNVTPLVEVETDE